MRADMFKVIVERPTVGSTSSETGTWSGNKVICPARSWAVASRSRSPPFMVGKVEIWMPVAGDYVGNGAVENQKPIIVKDPTVLTTMKVVSATMECNKHPTPDVFTIKHKIGTPVSDNLRNLEYEFGQQKTRSKPALADAQRMLREQIARVVGQEVGLAASSGLDSWGVASWMRVITIIDKDLITIIDAPFRRGGIVPFPIRGWGTERSSPILSRGDANQQTCGRSGRPARAIPAPRPIARS